MSRGLAYYVPLGRVSIKNPEVIPYLIESVWHGQKRLSEKVWLNVRHNEDFGRHTRDTSIVCTSYHTVFWVSFDFDETSPYKKVTLHLQGQACPEASFEVVYANLWLDLNQPHHNCGIVISPVPFACDGKPKVPDVPCLREVIDYVLSVIFQKLEISQLMLAINSKILESGNKQANAGQIYSYLKKMRIVADLNQTMCCPNMDRKTFNEIFSQIV